MYEWQNEIINLPDNKRSALVVISRRAGKTTTAMQKAMLSLLSGKKILWVSPAHHFNIEIYRNILKTLEPIISYQANNKEIQTITKGQMWFASSDNPDSLRSKGFDLVIFDEMAFADCEQAWLTLRPTLAERKGQFLGITTPNGHDYFYHLFQDFKDNPEWYCVQKDYTCSPHLSHDEIEKARSEMESGHFRQEFCAEFVQSKGSLFKAEWLQDIMIDEMPDPSSMQRKMIATDLSLGYLHSDWQAVVFVGLKDGILYVDCQCKLMPVEELMTFVKGFYQLYKSEAVAFESNGFQTLCGPAFAKLFQVPPPILLVDNKVKKETRIARLGYYLEQKKIKILNNAGGRELFAELSDFPSPDAKDDACDALEVAIRCMVET